MRSQAHWHGRPARAGDIARACPVLARRNGDATSWLRLCRDVPPAASSFTSASFRDLPPNGADRGCRLRQHGPAGSESPRCAILRGQTSPASSLARWRPEPRERVTNLPVLPTVFAPRGQNFLPAGNTVFLFQFRRCAGSWPANGGKAADLPSRTALLPFVPRNAGRKLALTPRRPVGHILRC
jgi:hypothetical protein